MRTDLSKACAACRLRVRAAHASCPKCRGALIEAEKYRAPISIWDRIAETTAYWTFGAGALGGALVGVFWAWNATATIDGVGRWPIGIVATVLAGIVGALFGLSAAMTAVFALAFVGFMLVGGIGRRRASRSALRIEPLETPAASAGVRGAVVAGTTLPASALVPSAVAIRIRGVVEGAPIDDAWTVPFAIETSDGERVEVEPARAFVAIDPGEARVVRPNELEPLREYLRVRGIAVSASVGDLGGKIAIGVVATGETVEVTGTVTRRPGVGGEGGFRESAGLRVLSEGADGPLVIRRG